MASSSSWLARTFNPVSQRLSSITLAADLKPLVAISHDAHCPSTSIRSTRFIGSPVEGDPGVRYRLPILQREDGAVIKLGYLVSLRGKFYLVQDILVSPHNLKKVILSVLPASAEVGASLFHRKSMEVDASSVQPVADKRVSLTIAREGLSRVMQDMTKRPKAVMRLARKYQLASCIRRTVQRFLRGHALSVTKSLGGLDCSFDSSILGLSSATEWAIEYRIEHPTESSSHLDHLLGTSWDLSFSSHLPSPSYRILLSLDIRVDLNQELILTAKATSLSGHPCTSYRRSSLARLPRLLITEQGQEAMEKKKDEVEKDDLLTDATVVGKPVSIPEELTTSVLNQEDSVRNLNSAEGEITEDLNEEIAVAEGRCEKVEPLNNKTVEQIDDIDANNMDIEQNGNVVDFKTDIQTSDGSALEDSKEQSYMIVILPMLENYSVDTTIDTEYTESNEDIDEEETTDSLDLGYPITESPTEKDNSDEDDLSNEILKLDVILKEAPKITPEDVVRSILLSVVEDLPLFEDKDEGIVMLREEDIERNLSSRVSGELEPVVKTSTPVQVAARNLLLEAPDLGSPFRAPPNRERLRDLPRSGSPHQLPVTSHLSASSSGHTKVVAYIQSLPDTRATSIEIEERGVEKMRSGSEDNEGRLSVSFGEEESNLSVGSSVSRTSRYSDMANGRIGSGSLLGGKTLSTVTTCPFPEEWQFNTIPETIENDEDID